MNIEIANRLVLLRKKNSLSQEDLAAKLGISRQAVSKWERAESSPDTDNLIMLARLYHVSLDDLLKTNGPVGSNTADTENANSYSKESSADSQNFAGSANPYSANNTADSQNVSGSANPYSANNTADSQNFSGSANPYSANNAADSQNVSGSANPYSANNAADSQNVSGSANPYSANNTADSQNFSGSTNPYSANNAADSQNFSGSTDFQQNQPPVWGTPPYTNATPHSYYQNPAVYKKHYTTMEAIMMVAPVLSVLFLQFLLTIISPLHSLVGSAFAPLTSMLYLVLGFIFKQWHPGWLVFLMIPVFYGGIFGCYPVVVTILFLLAGFLFDKWHPAWMLYLTIPFFYIFSSHLH